MMGILKHGADVEAFSPDRLRERVKAAWVVAMRLSQS